MNFTIVALKAFGDFLIAYQSIKHLNAVSGAISLRICAGYHIKPLADALIIPKEYVEFVGDGSYLDVPPAFDIKRQGMWAAVNSLMDLRSRLHPFARDGELVFDRLGWRERFIAGGRRPIELPIGVDNIYLAYEELLRFKGFDVINFNQRLVSQSRSAVIVPGSRISGKVMPESVQAAIYTSLFERGISAKVLKLEGENISIPAYLPIQLLPRNFTSLIAALRNCDLVISADSLPAHLGEYLDLPTFVVSPTPNRYWLPRRAFLTNATASFDDLQPLTHWLVSLSDCVKKTPTYSIS